MELSDNRHDAVFDESREYRYSLTRRWDTEKPTLAWIMLNPSTADETENDPTIRRCINYAKDWGFGEMVVANLFALRATNPDELRDHPEPVGDENDEHLHRVCEEADMIIAAWGAKGSLRGRAEEVVDILRDYHVFVLDTTQDGQPVHPLYQPAGAEPEELVPCDGCGDKLVKPDAAYLSNLCASCARDAGKDV